MKKLFAATFKALYPDSMLTDMLAMASLVGLAYLSLATEWVVK